MNTTSFTVPNRTLRALKAAASKAGIGKTYSLPVIAAYAHYSDGTLTVTDFDTTLTVDVDGTGADTLVPLSLLYDTPGTINDVATITVTDNVATCGPFNAAIYDDVAEYPQLIAKLTPLDGPLSLDDLIAVAHSASDDQARPILTGVHVGDGAIVTTDSFVLSTVETPTPDGTLLIPKCFVNAAAVLANKLTPSTTWSRGDRDIAVVGDGWRAQGRLIEGEYPNWRTLFPNVATAAEVTFDGAELAKLLKSTSKITGDGTPVLFDFTDPNKAKVTVCREGNEVFCAYIATRTSDPYTFTFPLAFNAKRLVSVLLKGAVTLAAVDHLKPVVLTYESAPSLRGLTVPIRTS